MVRRELKRRDRAGQAIDSSAQWISSLDFDNWCDYVHKVYVAAVFSHPNLNRFSHISSQQKEMTNLPSHPPMSTASLDEVKARRNHWLRSKKAKRPPARTNHDVQPAASPESRKTKRANCLCRSRTVLTPSNGGSLRTYSRVGQVTSAGTLQGLHEGKEGRSAGVFRGEEGRNLG